MAVQLITMANPNFADVWLDWNDRIDYAIMNAPFTFNYTMYRDCSAYQRIEDPETQIPKDINTVLRRMRKPGKEATGLCCIAWVGYSKKYANLQTIDAILFNIIKNRKNMDYSVGLMSAYELSCHLDERLLEYPIPDINIISICYNKI